MNEIQTLIDLLTQKAKLAAMLAPSFPVVFPYPKIITMLRKLGFTYVAEVAAGAEKTNQELAKLMEQNPNTRYITSPCPTIVRMVKKTMPQYTKYFTQGVDSPMVATAKMVREKYPDYRPVFIGPCVLKKMEAKEDVPELNILAVTYQELSRVFTRFGVMEESNSTDKFDIAASGVTRIYPMDGGLAYSSGLVYRMKPGEVKIVSGVRNNIAAIKEFDTNPNIKLMDILNCPGGCISGPGINSSLTTSERRQKLIDYTRNSAGTGTI